MVGFLKLYQRRPIFTPYLSLFKACRWLKAPRSRTAHWYLFKNSLRVTFSLCLTPNNSITLSFETSTLRNCSTNSMHTCLKLLILPLSNFQYHSHARPSRVNENTLLLWACVKHYTPAISLKRSTWTKGSLEYLRSGNRKSCRITVLIISSERSNSLSNMILQLGDFYRPCSSYITWTIWSTSLSNFIARSGFCAMTWSRSHSTAFRWCLDSPFCAIIPLPGFNWPWSSASWPSTWTFQWYNAERHHSNFVHFG